MHVSGVAFLPTRGLAKERAQLFMKDVSEPLLLPRESQPRYLVERVSYEAHCVAITSHRDRRGKSAVRSGLVSVSGHRPWRRAPPLDVPPLVLPKDGCAVRQAHPRTV